LIARAMCVEPGAAGWEAAAGLLAARPGVVALEDQAERTVLLGTTADARAFVSNRCAASAEGKRAELGPVTARAVVTPVASGFEADLVYLAMARGRTPGAYAKLMARWGTFVVRLDAGDEFPETSVLAIDRAAGQRPESLLGPVGEQHAGRLADGAVDAFDLCRFPSILKQAPGGVACAYKEMGRCPAPCDGTEGMESYRRRVRGAVERLGLAGSHRTAGMVAEIKAAAVEGRYEAAAALKKVLGRIETLDAGGLRGVTTMDRFRHVVVGAGAKARTARVYGWIGGRLASVADVGVKDHEAVREVVNAAATGGVEMPNRPEDVEAVCVLTRWLGKAAGKHRVRVVRVEGEQDVEEVMAAVKWVARAGAVEVEVEEAEHGVAGGGDIEA
jgi:DNA polymerase-3 subunit epsilon